jgi:GNAT superfamily N-acetyltransferase
MRGRASRDLAQSRLEGDVLRHIVTLKMLELHGEEMELRFAEDGGGWAVLSLLPVQASDFDRRTYAGSRFVVLVDGTSGASKLELLEGLPAEGLVIKTYDDLVRDFARARLRARTVQSYVSFTPAAGSRPGAAPAGVVESGVLVPGIARMLANNGYTPEDLAGKFAAGARWFAAQEGGMNVSAGFVFPNFGAVWEIGGLFTEPAWRRQGHARRIVAAALCHLAAHGRVPRYQARSDNIGSIRLAQDAGLREFLRMDHLLANQD